MTDDRLVELQEQLREFAAERDWERYHTPKNLVMALAAEVGELLDLFQWLSPQASSETMLNPASAKAVRGELADVTIYLARLADVLNVDLMDAANEKISTNITRFPPTATDQT